jgi:hypothetical protein
MLFIDSHVAADASDADKVAIQEKNEKILAKKSGNILFIAALFKVSLVAVLWV